MKKQSNHGSSIIEVLIASSILVMAFLPSFAAIQSSQHMTSSDEHRLLAHRRAQNALNSLSQLSYRELQELAKSGTNETVKLDMGRHILASKLNLPVLDIVKTAKDIGAAPLDGRWDLLFAKMDTMTVTTYFAQVESGLARIIVIASWRDPISRRPRRLIAVPLVEDPWFRQ